MHTPIRRVLSLGSLVAILAVALSQAQTPGSSPLSPAPIGKTINGIVECGQGYTSHELYDIKITVLEVLRGDQAWERLKAAAASNQKAEAGQEHIIARVKFEYYARGVPGACVHPLAPEQFTAFSAEGADYKSTAIAPPKPEMRKRIKTGETIEGWVAFAVAKTDGKPLMHYSADAGGAVLHGGGRWFQLFKD